MKLCIPVNWMLLPSNRWYSSNRLSPPVLGLVSCTHRGCIYKLMNESDTVCVNLSLNSWNELKNLSVFRKRFLDRMNFTTWGTGGQIEMTVCVRIHVLQPVTVTLISALTLRERHAERRGWGIKSVIRVYSVCPYGANGKALNLLTHTHTHRKKREL